MEMQDILLQILEKVTGIEDCMTGLENRMSGIELEVKDLRVSMELNFRQTRVEIVDAVELVGGQVDTLGNAEEVNFKQTRLEIVETAELTGNRLDSLNRAISAVEFAAAQNSLDVSALKRRA